MKKKRGGLSFSWNEVNCGYFQKKVTFTDWRMKMHTSTLSPSSKCSSNRWWYWCYWWYWWRAAWMHALTAAAPLHFRCWHSNEIPACLKMLLKIATQMPFLTDVLNTNACRVHRLHVINVNDAWSYYKSTCKRWAIG